MRTQPLGLEYNNNACILLYLVGTREAPELSVPETKYGAFDNKRIYTDTNIYMI